jgi:hypothetical protein
MREQQLDTGRPRSTGRSPLSLAARLIVFSRVTAALGLVVILMSSGVDFRTTIPPGLFILLIPAGLVAFGRWRWTPMLAALSGLFIFVSYFPSGSAVRLLDPGQFGVFVGLWLQFVASFLAVGAGIAATIRNYRA